MDPEEALEVAREVPADGAAFPGADLASLGGDLEVLKVVLEVVLKVLEGCLFICWSPHDIQVGNQRFSYVFWDKYKDFRMLELQTA